MLIIASPRFQEHVTPPGHPERIERNVVFERTAAYWAPRGATVVRPRPASREELERVHAVAHVDAIAATSGHARMLDADTFVSPVSYEVALLAAGAAVQAVEHAVDRGAPGFALVRPPGHHAESHRAMGFCLFNNVAVAAAAMLARGLDRIAIVDVDVHHGNGTQAIFYGDPRVLYVSAHQHPFYPGTGDVDEVGHRDGVGFTVNVPMEAGSTDADYAIVLRDVVEPVLDAFRPQVMLVSAGYDAHERDPLASMRMTTGGYAATVRRLKDIASRHGAFALVTEGGYELSALGECLHATCAVLADADGSHPDALAAHPAPRGERAVAAASAVLRSYWPLT
jgi:acetoin utilization deacetylase AcuC-like enzyme